jgi:pimeloyl-ACP methyl ester carboxylesterase
MTELYWLVRPLLEEWAEVASYDPPGVGGEPAAEGPVLDAIARRGLAELDRREWTRCVAVADLQGGVAAIALASMARARVAGLALGHATLSYRRQGPGAPIYAKVDAAFSRLMAVDYRSAVRQQVAIWDSRRGGAAAPPPDELVGRIMERVPASTAVALLNALDDEAEAAGDLEPALRGLQLPLLLAKHEGCVSHTDEAFDGAVAAFPEAQTVVCPVRPCVSDEFDAALREFCDRVW